ncbi:hypothetical protein FRB99_002981 [Tulasnella sp. 403]|nr:hypothetical protein FRB99_002981 [Tulasnella sp. 403]
MLKLLFVRHPRFAVTSFCAILLFFWSRLGGRPNEASGQLRKLSAGWKSWGIAEGGLVDVVWRLKKSEVVYQRMVREREKLIQKFGPTRDDVLPWPKNREFYTLWDFFTPAFNCPYEVERIGALADGGKWVCGLSKIAKKKGCVVYSFGVDDESSFEASILDRTEGCRVWGYDGSVNDFGPEVRNISFLRSRAKFKPWTLAGKDDKSHKPPLHTLPTLMKMNGHTFIDILKIDIEGGEFSALRSAITHFTSQRKTFPVGQLQIQIHAETKPHVTDDDERKTFKEFLEWWEMLEGVGLRAFSFEPNLVFVNINLGTRPALAEYSFINIKADSEILH